MQDEVHEAVTTFAVVQCSVMQLAPSTIFEVYIPAVCATFDQVGDAPHTLRANMIRAVTRSTDYKLIKKGLTKRHAQRVPESSKLRIPFCTDMALLTMPELYSRTLGGFAPGTPQHALLARRVYVSMLTGICFILRKSEHIGAKGVKGKPPIKRKSFTFFDARGVIPYDQIGPGRPADLVTINIDFSKCDQTGFGRRTSHQRQPDSLSDVCILQVLEKWIVDTRSLGATEADDLYYIPDLCEYKVEVLHAAMALAAKAAGLPEAHRNPTSHSLRYGGATMMAAAGFPQYMVALYGGWVEGSSSLKKYTRPTELMLRQVSEHMAKMASVNTSRLFIMDAISRTH